MPNSRASIDFLLADTSAAAQLDNLVVHQSFLATSVDAALLGQCVSFALPLSDQGALELRECPHDRQGVNRENWKNRALSPNPVLGRTERSVDRCSHELSPALG